MAKVTLPPIEECATIRAMYEHEQRATNANEAAIAKTKLDARLRKHGLKRKHIPDILAALEKDPKYATQRDAATQSADLHPDEMRINPLSLVLRHIEDYIYMPNPHLRLATALWIIHTHVCGKPRSPRRQRDRLFHNGALGRRQDAADAERDRAQRYACFPHL